MGRTPRPFASRQPEIAAPPPFLFGLGLLLADDDVFLLNPAKLGPIGAGAKLRLMWNLFSRKKEIVVGVVPPEFRARPKKRAKDFPPREGPKGTRGEKNILCGPKRRLKKIEVAPPPAFRPAVPPNNVPHRGSACSLPCVLPPPAVFG